MLDLATLLTLLKENGVGALAIAYLLWDRRNLTKRIESCQDAHRVDLQQTVAKVTESITTSTEVTRANSLAMERSAAVMAGLNETVTAMRASIAGMEKDLERLERGASA